MALNLDPRLESLVEQQPFPGFSDDEFARRRSALIGAMQKAQVDHLIVCGEQRVGSGVAWITGWPATTEALVVVSPDDKNLMFMEWYNHVPLATRMARHTDVKWGEHAGISKVIDELQRRGAKRVGFMGPLAHRKCKQLEGAFEALVEMNRDYVELRLIKSNEELDWLRVGAAYSDAAIEALRRELKPGLNERDLWDITERAYTRYGGTTQIHFFGATSMANPDCCVPRQFPENRTVQAGDCVFCEISGSFGDYPGQVLRTFTVGAEPTPLYRDLYATAEAAFDAIAAVLRAGTTPQQIIDVSGVIEKAGFTTCDDILHGYGGGYFPPVLGSQSRPAGRIPDLTLQAGMTVVVQPNVITKDQRAGVQVGELVHITEHGFERLHKAPRALFRVG
ncbi:MAG TPA: M24 family metallopeptidase [Burkholderiales bacterium]|jgi:Xaa-Pro dipeptidase|nr:M24 family metallopeptidase [Burkholderiales bacterium]